MAFALQLPHDRKDLAGGLALSPDDLRKAFPKDPMVIDPGKTQSSKGRDFNWALASSTDVSPDFTFFRRRSSFEYSSFTHLNHSIQSPDEKSRRRREKNF